MTGRSARWATILAAAGLAVTACSALPNPTAISSTPSSGSPVPGIPQTANPPGNTTAITSLTIPDAAGCTSDDGTVTSIDVAWTATGNVQGITWTRDGSELGDGYDASGALSLPFVCDGLSHHYGLVVQGENWPSDYQVADKIVQPGATS